MEIKILTQSDADLQLVDELQYSDEFAAYTYENGCSDLEEMMTILFPAFLETKGYKLQ
jgi:hypothetical protein